MVEARYFKLRVHIDTDIDRLTREEMCSRSRDLFWTISLVNTSDALQHRDIIAVEY